MSSVLTVPKRVLEGLAPFLSATSARGGWFVVRPGCYPHTAGQFPALAAEPETGGTGEITPAFFARNSDYIKLPLLLLLPWNIAKPPAPLPITSRMFS